MMQQCEHGHLYDPAVNRRCPHCAIIDVEVADTTPATIPAVTPLGPVEQGRTAPPGQYVDSGRTVPWLGIGESGGKDSFASPVVGWLVAIEGPTKGRDYRIFAEGNSIGRDPGNKICIPDESVHRDKHAILRYDPRDKSGSAYYLSPGDGPMVYVNDQAVYQPLQLHPYDDIRLGKTKLMFVPLCNDKFQWDWGETDAKTEQKHK